MYVCVYVFVCVLGHLFPTLPITFVPKHPATVSYPVTTGFSLCPIYLFDKYFLGAYCVLGIVNFTVVSFVEDLYLEELKDFSLLKQCYVLV